jgi:nicotinamide-nucleotide amidase
MEKPMNYMAKIILKKLQYFFKKADQFLTQDQTIEFAVGRHLMEKNATIAMAESCTGGLVAHRLTNVAGSSDYFLFSAVTYSNESKIKLLGVLPETIEKYGAVHEETAKEMAIGAMRTGHSTYGLSTSGIAGPAGGTTEKPVGTVCIGLASVTMVMGRRFYFPALDRLQNKEAFATAALKLLLKKIEKDYLDD